MHDHLRDMGREIADVSLPRRLWRPTDRIDDDMLQQSSVISELRGIRMFVHKDSDSDDHSSVIPWYQRSGELFGNCGMKLCSILPNQGSICMRNLQLLDTKGALVERILTKVQFPNLIWLRWHNCPYSSLPSSISLKNLRVIQVQGRKLKTLWGKELQAPLQLRELEIKAPLSNIPKSIGKLTQLERIVICPYHYKGNNYNSKVNVTQLPEEICFLQSLKALELEGFSKMKSLPERFGELTNLRQIRLSGCSAMKSLPERFGELTNLRQISLRRCSALKRLPDSLGNLTNLHHINLTGCLALECLPNSLGNLTSLHHIDLSLCLALERLPDSFCKLNKLQHLVLLSCTNLTMSSETLGNVSTLLYINLTGCRKVEVLPPQVLHQVSLRRLFLTDTNIKELPSAIGGLHDLEVLHVGPLSDTQPPPSLWNIQSLKELELLRCKELKCLPTALGDLRNLKVLRIRCCEELECWPTCLGLLTQLTELRVTDCPLIRQLPFKKEEVKGERETSSDRRVSSIDHCILPLLEQLDLSGTGISEVSFAEGVCFNLRELIMNRCNSLVEVGTLPNTLTRLTLDGCHSLRKMDQIYGLSKLSMLAISDCTGLEELPCLETLVSLGYLNASGCVKLKRIRGLGQLTKLKQLYVDGCSELEELEGIQHCMSLRQLRAKECPKLQWDAAVVKQLSQRMRRGFQIGSCGLWNRMGISFSNGLY